MTDRAAAVRRAVAAGAAEILADPFPDVWFFVSFADPARPAGTQFLGGLYVRGATFEAAWVRSHALGINPGGEAQFIGPLTTAELDENGVPPADRERLLTREEVGS